MKKQIEIERWAIAESLSKNFHINDEGWDASDFEWAAHCLLQDGYRKASEVVVETISLAVDKVNNLMKNCTFKQSLPYMKVLKELQEIYNDAKRGQ